METSIQLDEELSKAIDCDDINKVVELIKKGANIHLISQRECSNAFSLACCFNNKQTIKLMINAGANIHGNKYNMSGLHYAAMNMNMELINYFLDSGVDINSRNGRISVIYITWLRQEDPEIIKYLIDRGAKLPVNTKWVKDALNKGYDFEAYFMSVSNVKSVKRK